MKIAATFIVASG